MSDRPGAVGPARAAGLAAATLAVMLGLVLSVNTERYGTPGLIAGIVLAVAGVAAWRRLFRRRATGRTSQAKRRR
ncbi:MAG: hypothetical protein ACE5HQ_10140 [Gemmatimonadota bacterium]